MAAFSFNASQALCGSTLAAVRKPRVKGARQTLVRAGQEDRNVDWDTEWKSYVNERCSSYPNPHGQPRVRTSNRAVPVDPAAKITRDAIKREEAFLLNAWSSSAFQSAGAVAAVLVLLITLVAAGPPPADSRCTLPWC